MTWSSDLFLTEDVDARSPAAAASAWELAELAFATCVAPPNRFPDTVPASGEEDVVRASLESAARERAVAEAFARGRDEGRRAGVEEEQARLRGACRALETATARVLDLGRTSSATLRDDLCALSLAMARQLVQREMTADPALLGALARRAIEEFAAEEPVRVRLNPEDLLALAALGEATAGVERSAHWIADPAVGSGGCIVEGRERIVDGRVDTALERLYRRLTASDA